MINWLNSWKRALLVCEVMIIAMCVWMGSWFTDQHEAGRSISIGGFQGSYMQVTASTEVCVQAISESGDFEVDTPNGYLKSTIYIGKYTLGSGCFDPGEWRFVKNPPVMQLYVDQGIVEATSYVPSRVRYGTPIGMFVIMNLFIGFFALLLWARATQARRE